MAPFKAQKVHPDAGKYQLDEEEGSGLKAISDSYPDYETSSLLSSTSDASGHLASSDLNLFTLELLNEEDRDMYNRSDSLLGLKLLFFR